MINNEASKEASARSFSLNQIYFYLTEGCNLCCRHCWIAPKYEAEGRSYPALPLDSFRSIIEQAKPLGLSGVKLTGGEPLLHPQILEILEIVRQEAISLTMETNAVLCTPDLAQKIAAGKDSSVGGSLDGADIETHEWVRGVDGCFGAALQGIRNLVNAGLKPQVIMTLMRRNRDQIEAVVRLSETLGAGSVKFNVMQPTARGEAMHKAGETLTIEEILDIGRWVENELSILTNLRLYFSHPPAFRPLGRMFGEKGDGCGICGIFGILGVLADGSYALCGIGETVPDLVFGHVQSVPLKDVWDRHPVLLEIRKGLPYRLQGVCGECLMKSVCLGSCLAQNYYRSKSLWAPFWYCQQARSRGLFPESRMGIRASSRVHP